jgi:hypothetical protein
VVEEGEVELVRRKPGEDGSVLDCFSGDDSVEGHLDLWVEASDEVRRRR